MTEKGRKASPAGERKREELRRAAFECFREHGYHETTVETICQRAKTSKGSFYWHYQSKQEVFADILETWTREVMDELYEQFETAVIAENYVQAVTQALARETRRGRVILPLWFEFVVQAHREPELRAALSKFHRRARIAIAAILRPAFKGHCTEAELEAAAATIFGGYLGLMMQDVADAPQSSATEHVRVFMGLVGRILAHLPPREGGGDPAVRRSETPEVGKVSSAEPEGK